jgi:DNA modification methylase
VWGASDPACQHDWGDAQPTAGHKRGNAPGDVSTSSLTNPDRQDAVPRATTAGRSCVRCGAWLGQLGLEPTPRMFVEHMVEVFREVRRVLRADGTCWINEGDSYSNGGKGYRDPGQSTMNNPAAYAGLEEPGSRPNPPGLKPKDLCLIPFRLALALQADGWWVRDIIVWRKPAPMPESIRDRCTKSWEPILMLSKSERYFFDGVAIAEPLTCPDEGGRKTPPKFGGANKFTGAREHSRLHSGNEYTGTPTGTRNRRNVWTLPPMPTPHAHFASFPLELPELCIMAGTSERGVCPQCGAPWTRIVERAKSGDWHPDAGAKKAGINRIAKNSRTLEQAAQRRMIENTVKARAAGGDHDNPFASPATLGWQAACDHDRDPIPATVLDPFAGIGTTGLACAKIGREFIGIELNADYIRIAAERMRRHMPLLAEKVTEEYAVGPRHSTGTSAPPAAIHAAGWNGMTGTAKHLLGHEESE